MYRLFVYSQFKKCILIVLKLPVFKLQKLCKLICSYDLEQNLFSGNLNIVFSIQM